MSKIFYRGQLNGAENPVLFTLPIKNSAHVAVGEAVQWDAGVDTASTSSTILGVCVGLVDSDGIQLQNTGQVLDGTYAAATETYTAASDNMTVLGVCAQVIIDKGALYEIDLSSGSVANTDLFGGFHLANGTQIGDASPEAVKGQFKLIKLVAGNTAKGIFVINESVLDGSAQIA